MPEKTHSELLKTYARMLIDLCHDTDVYYMNDLFLLEGDRVYIMDLYETLKDQLNRNSIKLLFQKLRSFITVGADIKLIKSTDSYDIGAFPKDKTTMTLLFTYSPERTMFRTFQQELGKFVIGEPADIPRFIEILETLDQALDADN